jgi:hypothetical protein
MLLEGSKIYAKRKILFDRGYQIRDSGIFKNLKGILNLMCPGAHLYHPKKKGQALPFLSVRYSILKDTPSIPWDGRP